jgi:acid phosphatase
MVRRFANSLTPTNSCPKFINNETHANNYRATYRPIVAARLNQYLEGLELTPTDIGVMMDLCVSISNI